MIDTHSHIYLPQFDHDRDEVIQRAIDTNIEAILMPNIDTTTIEPMQQLSLKYQGYCFPMAGLHPTNVKHDFKKQLDIIEKQLLNNNIVAIGETGIDLYWDKTHIKEQIAAFEYQIALAVHTNMPVVIHARDSLDTIFQILDNNKSNLPKGVFHCFSGQYDDALRIIDYGMLLGIGGVVTFKNGGLDKIINRIDLKNIVLETDSPYLAPVPYRGKRNEPSYIRLISNKIAEIYNLTPETVEIETNRNAIKLFSLENKLKEQKQ